MNPALQPFMTVALPIMVTLTATMWISSWSQDKRFDDMNHRFDEVIKRLDRIELKLDSHEQRFVRLEERTSLLHR